jgi:hypothetical protein
LFYNIFLNLLIDVEQQLTLGDNSTLDQQQTSSSIHDTSLQAASIQNRKRTTSESRGGGASTSIANRTIQHQARRTSRAVTNNEIETQLESLVQQTGNVVHPSHYTLHTTDNQGSF